MCINAVADSVMLYLQHDFYKIIFKIKHKLYLASGTTTPPPPKGKILSAYLTFSKDHHGISHFPQAYVTAGP
jgi:hypothetical protein